MFRSRNSSSPRQPKGRPANPFQILRSQKGVALLMALISLSLMYFIAMEVSYDSAVDYVVAKQQVERIKARYAAKAGVELSLLRIMIYKQVVAGVGSSLGGNVSMLDPIWSFPFMWPPTLALAGSPKSTEVDKDMLKDAMKESLMQAQYTTTISPIGGHFDLNDLGSDIKTYRKLMMDQVLQMFKSEVEHNEDFRRKYGGYDFQTLVNNIADYVSSPEMPGLNGGDKSAPYKDLPDHDITMPPQRPFRTMDELHQVAGMNDDFYNLLAARTTIYGTKGINVNYAPKEVLMSLDESMKEEAVDRAIQRRADPKQGGPFKNDQDFFGLLNQFGVNTKALQDSKLPLLYDMEFNFRIVSTGLSSNVKREITAIVYDYPNLTQRLITMLNDQEKQDQSGGANPSDPAAKTPDPNTKTDPNAKADPGANKPKIQAAKGRPAIVYWEEN
jgi:general secretion pathway protein K